MKLYVRAKSKKALNEVLAEGKAITGTNHSIFGDGGDYALDDKLADKTVIAIYDKTVGGSPYAKTYGTWDAAKRRVK